jgi:recombination protein RecT
MNTKALTTTGVKALSSFINSDAIKSKFASVLGENANGFIASLLSVVNSDGKLATADQNSIYTSALLAASLKLPINPNLGFAYLIAYNSKQADGSYKNVCQFQLGYKGFKQLAQRSGQFLTINETDVREGELLEHNRLSGVIDFKWNQDPKGRLKKKVVGYVSYFKLVNGFESTFYMTVEEIEAHAKKYSQTYKKYGSGLWKDEFDGMARKTVAKLNLSKNAPLSVDMQRAVLADQAVIKDFDPSKNDDAVIIETDYVDNTEEKEKSKETVAEEKKNLKQADIKFP